MMVIGHGETSMILKGKLSTLLENAIKNMKKDFAGKGTKAWSQYCNKVIESFLVIHIKFVKQKSSQVKIKVKRKKDLTYLTLISSLHPPHPNPP